MKNDEILKALISRYELSEPVSPDVRLSMEKARRDALVSILKKDAKSALYTTVVVSFFLWLKKFGIPISISKSAVAVTAAITIGAGGITAAGIYGTVKIARYLSSPQTESDKSELTSPSDTTAVDKKPAEAPQLITYALAVAPVEMEDVSRETISLYTGTVIKELQRTAGSRAAINLNMLDRYRVSEKILTISIIMLNEKSGTSWRISAKIINSANSQVLSHISETVNNEADIHAALRNLAARISAGL
jgi:dsDNA-binding SOS-regulon protein